MKFTKLIKPIVPYGLVMWSREKKKRKATFWELYEDFLEKDTHIDLKDNSPFKQLVSIQGSGHSGSSAVMDVLREYDNTLSLGEVDLINSIATPDEYSMEVDFLRLAGGMLEIEKYIGSNNHFHNDALLQRFMLMAQNTPFYRFSIEGRNILFEFFRRISYSLGGVMQQSYYNIHLPQADVKHPQIFFLRDMSLEEYRNLCRRCINSLFDSLYQKKPKEILVVDQFFADGNYTDFNRNYEYCPNLKTIYVWRDPRDVFKEAKWFGAEWLSTKNAEVFVAYFKHVAAGRTITDTKDYLSVRFEDLCLHYEETVARIENYLGLKPEQHVAPKTCFEPNISGRSVRLWQKYPKYKEEYERIAQALPEYLYND